MNFSLIYQCNAMLTSTVQKIATVCYSRTVYNGTSTSIDSKFTSQTINDEFSADYYASSMITLSSCQYDCSANFTVKVNSVSNCNIYFSTAPYYFSILNQLGYKEGKAGGEYSFSLSGSYKLYISVLTTIFDSSQKMAANYTVILSNCDSQITSKNSVSIICNNNSASNSEGTKGSLSTVDIILIATISLMFLLISLAFCLLIVVMLILNHKLRTELRGYNLQPKKDEREEIEIQKPTNEERQNTDSLVNIEFGP